MLWCSLLYTLTHRSDWSVCEAAGVHVVSYALQWQWDEEGSLCLLFLGWVTCFLLCSSTLDLFFVIIQSNNKARIGIIIIKLEENVCHGRLTLNTNDSLSSLVNTIILWFWFFLYEVKFACSENNQFKVTLAFNFSRSCPAGIMCWWACSVLYLWDAEKSSTGRWKTRGSQRKFRHLKENQQKCECQLHVYE